MSTLVDDPYLPPHEDCQEIVILREDPRWAALSLEDSQLIAWVKCALEAEGAAKNSYEISVVLSHNAQLQDLNRTYRGKDKPTNVLSFFYSDGPLRGDLVLSYDVVTEEAQAQGKSVVAHVAHLLVHGTLHLLGYDHEEQDQAEDMENLEIKILFDLGFTNPYEERDQKNGELG